MRTARDPLYPFLSVRRTNKYDYLHTQFISFLISQLFRYFPRMNFDHLNCSIPKDKSIPLKYKGKLYDIALDTPTHTIYIEIKTQKKGTTPISEKSKK